MISENDKGINIEMLASIAESAFNSIILLKENGDILWANKGFEQLYGYTFEEYERAKGKEDQEFIGLLNEIDHEFFKNNAALTYTRAVRIKTGDRKWVQSTLTPVKNAENKIERFIVIETDITQQKEVEEELRQREENTQTLSEHIESVKDYIEDQIAELNDQKRTIEAAKQKSEDVLNKVLPYEVAIQLKKKGFATPRHYKKVTLLQLSVRNFMDLANTIPIDQLVGQLHNLLVRIDGILEVHYVEKIKTIGGNYLAAGGVPLRNRSNPFDVVLASLQIKNAVMYFNKERIAKDLPEFEIGFGIHTGKAIAGVVGKNKLSYDMWGETVNVSSAVESESEIGRIMITQDTKREIDEYFECTKMDTLVLKNTEKIDLYEVNRIKPEYSENNSGITPNKELIQLLSKL